MLLRPQWATTPERQKVVAEKALVPVGRPADFTGLVGLNVPDRYYGSG
ncbi:MAG: hypothetical protein IPP58_07440 [Holophagaceae bacterium]|uniref:Uncharacterized protein n=1 Tax=Candidatus Geothrix skivensis TaxID=2954439 RepID=A0A9D7SH15_9BACT|nr:hypothetical protein [Candidatus Geothrix skivensis]